MPSRALEISLLLACWPYDMEARDESHGPWTSSGQPLSTTVKVAHLKMSTFSEHSLPSRICTQTTGVSSKTSFQAEEVELDRMLSPHGTTQPSHLGAHLWSGPCKGAHAA